jgi:hypothetical protein
VHPGDQGGGTGGVADGGDAEQPGHDLVVSERHGEAAAGKLGREEIGPGERLGSDDVAPT